MLVVTLFAMSSLHSAHAQGVNTQINMYCVSGDIYGGTVGPRRAPSKVVCPLNAYVNFEERIIVLNGGTSWRGCNL